MSVTASSPSVPLIKGIVRTDKILAPGSTKINKGDMLWRNSSGVCAIASAFTWTSDLATTQANFRALFLGYSLDNRSANDTSSTQYITYCSEGDVEYSCTALGSAVQIGTFVGPDKDTGNNLLDQVVINVAGSTQGIGKVIMHAPVGSTKLVFNFRGFHYGSVV